MTKLPESFQKFLDDISHRGIHRGLDRMWKAVDLLGHPQKKFPVIHLAGTNGKGSTCQFMAQILAANGYHVGLALSPHVDDYCERIQISDQKSQRLQLIPVEDLLRVHDELLSRLPEELSLTYFEWNILLALQYFADQKVDYAVLETGMGGRWDATNVCESVLSGITTVGLDHCEFLGNTVEEILEEKLQVVKPGSSFLFGPNDPDLVEQAKAHCKKVGANFHLAIPPVESKGFLQRNWNFAVQAIRLLRPEFSLQPETLEFSKNTQVPPARLEVISEKPIILIDGAHNEQGLKALKEEVGRRYGSDYALIFGCLKDRPFLELASLVVSRYENFWLKFNAEDRTTPEAIYQEVQTKRGGCVVGFDENFFSVIQKLNRPLVVCGSFYLCSQFKKWWSEKMVERRLVPNI